MSHICSGCGAANAIVNECGCDLANLPTRAGQEEPRAYYVSVVDAGRTGFLLGPYDTHEEAKRNLERGKDLALAANAWAHFYAFGTCSLPPYRTPKTVFGK